MSKQLKPGRSTVELRPSRIRREPPPKPAEIRVNVVPEEREAWVVAIGILLFGLALFVITIGISDITSK